MTGLVLYLFPHRILCFGYLLESPLERRFHASQITIIMNFDVVSSVSIKMDDCTSYYSLLFELIVGK